MFLKMRRMCRAGGQHNKMVARRELFSTPQHDGEPGVKNETAVEFYERLKTAAGVINQITADSVDTCQIAEAFCNGCSSTHKQWAHLIDVDTISEDKLDAFIYEKGPYYDDDLAAKEEEKQSLLAKHQARAFAAATASESAKEIAMLRHEIEKLKAGGASTSGRGIHCWGYGEPGVMRRDCKKCSKKKAKDMHAEDQESAFPAGGFTF